MKIKQKAGAASLGVIRLDYDYPPAPGDIDCPDTFSYDVYYKVVPGFTFEMAQSGKMTDQVEHSFKESVRWLVEEKKVKGITGDCGFMMFFQKLARAIDCTNIPIFMSSLCQLPAVTCAYAANEQIIILTANAESLEGMREVIRQECGVDTQQQRYHIIGCGDVDGFEAVANGTAVDIKKVTPGMVRKAKQALKKYPDSRAFLLECTEMAAYSDAIRYKTGLPVYDSVTACNFFIGSCQDDARFGINNWQDEWDGEQDKYEYGENLSAQEKLVLVNKAC